MLLPFVISTNGFENEAQILYTFTPLKLKELVAKCLECHLQLEPNEL